MQSVLRITVFLSMIIVLGMSCSEEKKDCSNVDKQNMKSINPNGDSELALLMREMFEEAERVKQQIANKEPITFTIDYEKVLTAHATEPEKAASATYKAFANSYLQNMQALQTANPSEVGPLYTRMVDNCMNCHQALCPGPMVKIKKLE